MSAYNWAMCPQCVKNDKADYAERSLEVNKLYGVVSPEVYMDALADLRSRKPLEATLREDYGIGIRDGEFYVAYSAFCFQCQYKFEYKYSEDVK